MQLFQGQSEISSELECGAVRNEARADTGRRSKRASGGTYITAWHVTTL